MSILLAFRFTLPSFTHYSTAKYQHWSTTHNLKMAEETWLPPLKSVQCQRYGLRAVVRFVHANVKLSAAIHKDLARFILVCRRIVIFMQKSYPNSSNFDHFFLGNEGSHVYSTTIHCRVDQCCNFATG